MTEIALLILSYLFVQQVSTTAEELGSLVGTTFLPIFNSHLLTRYVSSKFITKYELITMLIVGTISLLFINPTPILLAILGAMLVNKLRNPKIKTA